MVALQWGARTDVGRARSLNEDSIVSQWPVFAVADGMGGHAAGEVASQLTADHIAALGETGEPTGERLIQSIRAANREIFNKSLAEPDLRGMGTTVCALTIVGDHISIANVGDSRVYTVQNGELLQVSEDHSYVAELVASGEITWTQARSHPHRNIVTRALGIDADVRVDLWEVPALVGQRFLLCSDGLVDEVDDQDIASILNRHPDAQQAADALVVAANRNGGHDNISVVVVDVVDEANIGAGNQRGDNTSGRARVASGTTVAAGSSAADDLNWDDTVAPAGRGATYTAPLPIAPYDGPSHDNGIVDPSGVSRDGSTKTSTKNATKTAVKTSLGNRIRGIVFVLALVGIVATIVGGVRFYGTAGTYVSFSGEQVAVYQGRPGGVLWVKPSLIHTAKLTRAQLSGDARSKVAGNLTFTDVKAADAWIDALGKNPNLAPGNMPATTTTAAPTTTTTTSTTTTTPTTTVAPAPVDPAALPTIAPPA